MSAIEYLFDRRDPRDLAEDWRDEARCRETDPEVFHPEKGGGSITTVRAAKRICAACPVREACLRDALEAGHVSGVWGGLSERERRPLVVALRRQARTATAA